MGAELVIYSDDIAGHYIDYDDFVEYVAELREAHEKELMEIRLAVPWTDAEATKFAMDHYAMGVRDSKPRTLTADDPEPGVRSVVLDDDWFAWQRLETGWVTIGLPESVKWSGLSGPVTLIHDGGKGGECYACHGTGSVADGPEDGQSCPECWTTTATAQDIADDRAEHVEREAR